MPILPITKVSCVSRNRTSIAYALLTGRTRFDRLLLIGLSSTYLYLDALKAAVREAKAGEDVQQYETAMVALQDMAFRDPDAKPDQEWMERTKKRNTLETSKLEGELKGYKNNLIKESIRVCRSFSSTYNMI